MFIEKDNREHSTLVGEMNKEVCSGSTSAKKKRKSGEDVKARFFHMYKEYVLLWDSNIW